MEKIEFLKRQNLQEILFPRVEVEEEEVSPVKFSFLGQVYRLFYVQGYYNIYNNMYNNIIYCLGMLCIYILYCIGMLCIYYTLFRHAMYILYIV